MEYEKLGRHLRDFANHEVWYLHQGQRETCVPVSQTKIFFSDALTGFFFFFFPIVAIFTLFSAWTVEL